MKIAHGEWLMKKPDSRLPGLTKPADFIRQNFQVGEDVQVEPLAQHILYESLSKVHDIAYIARVLDGETNGYTSEKLAFGGVSHICEANRSILAAVDEAVWSKDDRVVCVPVCGFHHAGWNFGGSYCTFNGLILAAERAARVHGAKRILILDGDGHFGNGTQELLDHHRPAALKDAVVKNWSHTQDYTDSREMFLSLYEILKSSWDLILYQAGADAHKDDPYGAGYLHGIGWAQRDETIFKHAYINTIPLVWNLAGGYNGEKTLELHRRTAQTHRAIRHLYGAGSAHAAAKAVLQIGPGGGADGIAGQGVIDDSRTPHGGGAD